MKCPGILLLPENSSLTMGHSMVIWLSSSGGVNIDRACMECFDCNDGLSLDLRGCEAHSQSGTPVGLPVIGYSFYKKWELGWAFGIRHLFVAILIGMYVCREVAGSYEIECQNRIDGYLTLLYQMVEIDSLVYWLKACYVPLAPIYLLQRLMESFGQNTEYAPLLHT